MDGVELLDRLLVSVSGTSVAPGRARELAVCDCDRLFAALYVRYYGERIESTVPCRSCSGTFEASFSLRELAASLEPSQPASAAGPDADGFFVLADGRRFRLPTGDDQRLVAGLDPERAISVLVDRCIANGGERGSAELVQAAMGEVGPTLDIDLDVVCPHCGHAQEVRFDIQTHLIQVLSAERRFLHREIHQIAVAYQWSLPQILGLSREDRRMFVRMILAEREAQTRPPA